MSEKPTEIIYVDETIYNEPPPGEASGMKKGEWRELAIMHYRTAYILKSKFDLLEAENQKLKAELEKVKGRSNRKLSDRFTEILNKFTEEEIQRWIDFDANRMNGKTK